MTHISQDLIWWITVVDLPAMGGLLLLLWRVRGENLRHVNEMQIMLDRRCDQLRDALASFKLEVAKNYASQRDLRLIEMRLVEHLLRIEQKLDKTALKAAAFNAQDARKN